MLVPREKCDQWSLLLQAVPIQSVAAGVGAAEGVVMEIIITFALVYSLYATAADPNKGSLGTTAPIAIGLIVGKKKTFSQRARSQVGL